jgi:hypothetical protein
MRRRFVFVLAVVFAGTTLGLSAGTRPALADDGKAGQSAAVNSGGSSTQDFTCLGYFSPEPQYSASNKTIHYGGLVQCNYAAEIFVKVSIESKLQHAVGACRPIGAEDWRRIPVGHSARGNRLPR